MSCLWRRRDSQMGRTEVWAEEDLLKILSSPNIFVCINLGVVVLLYTWSQAWITVAAPPLTVKYSLNSCELIVWALLLGKAADQGARVAASWCNTCSIKLLSEPCRNAHNSAGFINMKKAPIFLHFTHLLEAGPTELGIKAWNQQSHLLLFLPITQRPSAQQRKCRVRSVFPLRLLGWCEQGRELWAALLQPFEGLSGAPCSEPSHSGRNRGKKAISTELGTILWHNVQLQFSLPKLSVGDHIQGGGGWFLFS